MTRKLDSVAVLGGGTMGSGIAGACAEAGCRVLLLDVTIEAAQKSLDRIVNGRPPAIDTPEAAKRIELGSFDELARITKPGGLIVFSLRVDMEETHGFKEQKSGMEEAGVWQLAEMTDQFQPLPKGEPEVWHRIWAYRVN